MVFVNVLLKNYLVNRPKKAMKKITVLLFLLSSSFSFSQSTIEGFIFDKETNNSLPYATIKIISSTNYYTITNEDGKF
jgi:hypothetical protein